MHIALLALCCGLKYTCALRVFAFGDSLTAGMVDRATYSPYGASLQQFLPEGSIVESSGVVLESSHAMPTRLARELSAHEEAFDIILILGGSNDLWRGDHNAIMSSLDLLYKQVHHAGAALGVATLPPFEPDIMRWLSFTGVLAQTESTRVAVNERIRDMAASADGHVDPACGAFLVDLARLCEQEPQTMARPDGLHFTAEGYQRLGEEAAAALLAALPSEKILC